MKTAERRNYEMKKETVKRMNRIVQKKNPLERG